MVSVPQIAYIGVGSNLGDRLANCRAAWDRIGQLPSTRLLGASSLYETEPHVAESGGAVLPYINAVLAIETALSPIELLKALSALEMAEGRPLAEKGTWRPRTLDLDLLAWGEAVLSTPELTLPHPGIPRRRFVLEPWAEIAPDWRHPVLALSIRHLLEQVEDDKHVGRLCSF